MDEPGSVASCSIGYSRGARAKLPSHRLNPGAHVGPVAIRQVPGPRDARDAIHAVGTVEPEPPHLALAVAHVTDAFDRVAVALASVGETAVNVDPALTVIMVIHIRVRRSKERVRFRDSDVPAQCPPLGRA